MTDKHLSTQFDADLNAINTKLLQMGGLVESQIELAMRALTDFDTETADQVIAREIELNALEVEIDADCGNIIARRQPTARDLRLVMAISKTITNLERAGDEAEKIARMAKLIHEAGRVNMPAVELWHMANTVVTMLRKALDAFARLDAQAAAQVVRQDKSVDSEWQGVIRQLITYMIEDPRKISRSIELLFIAKALERIGDHAKNMCELVVYMVKGRDVRHTGVDNVEREAAAG